MGRGFLNCVVHCCMYSDGNLIAYVHDAFGTLCSSLLLSCGQTQHSMIAASRICFLLDLCAPGVPRGLKAIVFVGDRTISLCNVPSEHFSKVDTEGPFGNFPFNWCKPFFDFIG
jgi:hypothetical protein